VRLSRFVTLALVASLGCTRATPPNVVIVSVDTLNRDALRAFAPAAPELPGFDALARASVRFSEALATASWTLPSHASLLTGLYPDRHGATDRRLRLGEGVPTLAKELKRAGYETVAFTGGGYLDRRYGFAKGFERYEERIAGTGPVGPEAASDSTGADDRLERGLAFLATRQPHAVPLFLFLHSYAVHDYFGLHPATVERLPQRPVETPEELTACLKAERRCPPETWAELRRLYELEVAEFDTAVARLVDTLRARHLWDSTVLVLVSDHGEGFDPELGRTHHGGRLHGDVIRVPLLVRAPGIRPRTVDTPVSLVDVMPTLIDLLGVKRRPGLDGVSLAPLLRGGAPPPERPLFALEHAFLWTAGGRIEAPEVQAHPLAVTVIRGPDWYIRSATGEGLYDMARDPRQRDNLITRASPTELRARADARSGLTAPAAPVSVDARLDDRLRALGYVR